MAAALRQPCGVPLIVSWCDVRVGCLVMRSGRVLVRLVRGRKKARALAGILAFGFTVNAAPERGIDSEPVTLDGQVLSVVKEEWM